MKTKHIIYTLTVIALIIIAYIVGTMQISWHTIVIEKETIKTVEKLPDDFTDNYIDLRTVVDYVNTDDGLLLHTSSGDGYYLEISHRK